VTPREFHGVQRFGIAFDGSPTTRKCVNMVAMSPLLEGLECHLIVASDPSRMPEGLDWALETLREAGFDPMLQSEAGHAERVITAQADRLALDLLVMGAYGHSRVRHLIVGSTTTAVLRHCNIPILLLR
jgi:nucleotide-binding universal stress UspA family protein